MLGFLFLILGTSPQDFFTHVLSPHQCLAAHGGQQCQVTSSFPQKLLEQLCGRVPPGWHFSVHGFPGTPLWLRSQVLRHSMSLWTATCSILLHCFPGSSTCMVLQWLISLVNHNHALSKEAWNTSLTGEEVCRLYGCCILVLGTGLHLISAILYVFRILFNSHQSISHYPKPLWQILCIKLSLYKLLCVPCLLIGPCLIHIWDIEFSQEIDLQKMHLGIGLMLPLV